MKRYKIITLLGIVLLILIAASIWYVQKNIYALWYANELKIEADAPANKAKIKIYMGISVNTINRKDDSVLFDDMQKYSLIYDGSTNKTTNIENEYGENDFLITYNDEFYYSFRQFKTSRHAQHSYCFDIKKRDDNYLLSVNIKGDNPMLFSSDMLPIKDAERYVCNTPKKDVGILYNGIKLVNPE